MFDLSIPEQSKGLRELKKRFSVKKQTAFNQDQSYVRLLTDNSSQNL